MVDLGIVQFNKVASVNNASYCTTKIVPGFTWTSLSRFMIGASPKFIPGTQIDFRYAQQMAREQRARECDAHPPAARERVGRLLLHLAVEAEPKEDRASARRRRSRVDLLEPLGDLEQPLRPVEQAAAEIGEQAEGEDVDAEIVDRAGEEQAKVLEAVGDGRSWTADLVALWVGAVVLAPVAEEWVYRGLLFRRLRVWAPSWVAWSLPALIFAVSHGNWSGLAIYAWLALVFANAYRMNGKLRTARCSQRPRRGRHTR